MKKNNASRDRRNSRGNMIALTAAITVGIVLAILFFALKYVRILGRSGEQRTEIEAAALAAATDIAKITVEDQNFGFISLSDYAPIGNDTKAQDQYATPVRGINSILATVRLDMIIADQMGNSNMMTLAQNDYDNAMTAMNELKTALNTVVSAPGNPGRDIDGNLIDPYADAIAAYNKNVVRMAGEPNSMLPNSMKLRLGCLPNLPTNIQIPQPTTVAPLTSTQVSANCYVAYQDIKYDNKSFVFAGVGKVPSLIDPRMFVYSPPAVPYFLPSIVRAEADQQYQDTSQTNGSRITRVIHAVACAAPASVVDPRPAPGAFTISFPDGVFPEISKPGDILSFPPVANAPVSIYTPPNGDYPGGPNPPTTNQPQPYIPILAPPTVGNTYTTTIYTWLRRNGPKTNIKAAVDMQHKAFAPAGTLVSPLAPWLDGWMQQYEFAPDGTINYQLMRMPAGTLLGISDHQIFGVTKNDFKIPSTGANWDVVLTDEVLQEGRIKGGLHAGEPLPTVILNVVGNVLSVLTLIVDDNVQKKDYGAGGMAAGGLVVPMGDDILGLPGPLGALNLVPTKGWVGMDGAFMYRVIKLQNLGSPLIPAGGNNSGLNIIGMLLSELLNPNPSQPARTTYTKNGAAGDICFRKVKMGWCMP